MSSLTRSCEIVEESEESTIGQKPFADYQLNSGLRTGEHNGKLPVLKVGYKESLEDDINKLFGAISLKRPSKGSDKSEIGMSPKMKNVMKKAITVGVPGSPRIGNSEPVNMKQALRDLCISKASEMAAMKRLLKSSYAPATSEAGRIKTLYNAVVGEASGSGTSLIEDKDSIVGISLVPEETKSPYSTSLSSLKQPKMTSSQNTNYSPEVSCSTIESESGSSSLQKETSKMDLVLVEKNPSLPALSHSNSYATLLELAENILISSKPTSKTSTQKAARRGGMETTSSTSSSTSLIGKRVSKPRNAPRAVEQVLRNSNLNKKKTKPDSGSTVSTANNITGCNSEPGTSQLICERCRCVLKNMKIEENHDSVTSKHKSSKNGVSLSNVESAASKLVVTSTTCNRSRTAGKVNNITKLTEIGEISQSSKSSQGDHSSSTSTSDDSNASGSSCGNRPHMSKDSRWEAIRQVQTQYGVLDLKHFNLLKKLGSGDIGTVYLAELIGTNCLFAVKVMDNEFLVRRKKMPRAQTEREILRMLDHPFLPTLYAQFTSDNLSCLVMEYCPGGDLHVLRQRQLGRSFSEAAARFYVAEILLALEYLHMLGVVYRDLKPENILVREDGHIMLTDFDLSFRCSVSPSLLNLSEDTDPARITRPSSKTSCIEPFCIEPSCQVPCFSPRFLPPAKTKKSKPDIGTQVRALPQLVAEPTDARSNSFVGTHEYLAPEIIKGEGHGAAVDWWTFGIFLYELLYGRTPFKGSNNEETLANVVLQSLKFPDTQFVSDQARDLIRGLLVKEPENRLGTEKGAAELKQHPFFEGLNWALIRCAVPPEIPEFLDSQGNDNYLECYDDGEHLQLELF